MGIQSPVVSVTPNGKKIRELRLKLGKTQEGLLERSTLSLRTLQRAEQGQPIKGYALEEIARLCKRTRKTSAPT
jgi:transcriptional regulator with XRE-family HTH domain